jgi:hypothetical protein
MAERAAINHLGDDLEPNPKFVISRRDRPNGNGGISSLACGSVSVKRNSLIREMFFVFDLAARELSFNVAKFAKDCH